MDGTEVQWIGPNCGRHGSYTFYRGFRLSVDDNVKKYCLGEFYFVRNSSDQPICIAELQLVWYDANTDSKLASARLYFCPKDTPFGRNSSHGQDELLYADQKVVIKCADMVSWHCTGAEWNHGLIALSESNFIQKNGSFLLSYASLSTDKDNAVDRHSKTEKTSKIVILTFPAYCRYRALLKRLSQSYLTKAQVLALGGVIAMDKTTRIMFCRDCFHHPDLDKFELSGETKAPVLKGRPRRKKKLRGVPLTNVLKKKKFLADIQNCLSEDHRPTKRLKTSDEEDTESDRSEASAVSFESITDGPTTKIPPVQKQGPPPLMKPVIQVKPVKVEGISTQNGWINKLPGPLQTDVHPKVPPLIPANKAKQSISAVVYVPKLCIPQEGAAQSVKQISPSLKTDSKPPPLNSFAKTINPSKDVNVKQELGASIKKVKNVDSGCSSSIQVAKPKPLEGSVKPNATALAVSTVKTGVSSSHNSVVLVTSDITSAVQFEVKSAVKSAVKSEVKSAVKSEVKSEVKSDSYGLPLKCHESQGTLNGEKDMKEGKENFKELAPKKRKRLRQPGDLKDGLEEYEDEDEKLFMHSLRDFMKSRNTPIGKIPALGFKKVNLWTMYNTTQKLGGYDVVTSKRLWRYVYDSLGGSTTITSAATYSRRHYERLLLPYERYVRNQLLEKKERKMGGSSCSPSRAGPHSKPPHLSAKQDRGIAVVVPVSIALPSSVQNAGGPETVTIRPQHVPSKSEGYLLSQNRLIISQSLPKEKETICDVSSRTIRVEALSKDKLSKTSNESREVSRIQTSVQSKVTTRLPTRAETRTPIVQGNVQPGERKEVPASATKERPMAPSRQQHDVPQRAPPNEKYEVPRGPSREQCEVARVPSRDHYNGPRIPPRGQHDVSRSSSSEDNNKVPPRGLTKEPHRVPKLSPKQYNKVPRVPLKGQYNVPDKSTQERHGALGTMPKEQHRIPTREQREVSTLSSGGQSNVLRVPNQDYPNVPRANAEPKVPVKISHEVSKIPSNTHRESPSVALKEHCVPRTPSRQLQNVPVRVSEEQRNVFLAPARGQENALSRSIDVCKLNQHHIPRTPSREQQEEQMAPPRAHRDPAKAIQMVRNDAPRRRSRDGHTGPIGVEKAPVMNEHHFPRGRLEVHTSVGVIDLTNDESCPDDRSVYNSEASTPFTSSPGFSSRFPHALTTHEVGEAVLSEPQRTMQQMQQTVTNSYSHDDQSASALHSHHNRKLSSKPFVDKASAAHADHAHQKPNPRFHPYVDDRRARHSPSQESVDERLDWNRRLLAQHAHAIFNGVQAPSEQPAFHFFPYACMEPEYPQERRQEGMTEQKQAKDLTSQYAGTLAFQSCLSPASVSEAIAMRTPHASALKGDIASSMEHLYSSSRIFMPSPQLFSPPMPMEMVPMSPSVLAAAPLIAGSEEQFHIHPHCLMAAPYNYPVGSASIPYPLHSFT